MRELEPSLQQFGEFLLKTQVVRPAAAPYFVRWVRRFLSRPASAEPLADQVRGFCEELERTGSVEDWQVWHRRPASTVVDEQGSTNPLTALDPLRTRLRTRHYSYLAVHQQVSASTQNQASCAILFLCREILGVNLDGLSPGVRAKRGERLPVVLSMPETSALLNAMSGSLTRGRVDARRPGPQVPECGPGAGMVLGVSKPHPVHRSAGGRRPPTSHERFGCPEGRQGSSAKDPHPQARVGSHAATQFCHALAAERSGYPTDPGIPRTCERRDDDDLPHVVKELRTPARSPLDILSRSIGPGERN